MRKFAAILTSIGLAAFLFFPFFQANAAIAFDDESKGSATSSNTATISHITTASDNRLMIVHIVDVGTTAVSTVTYNGDSLTKFATNGDFVYTAGRQMHSFYMYAPDSGTHDIVVTMASATNFAVTAVTYSGVSQTGFPDSTCSAQDETAQAGLSCSTTTIADNAWLVAVVGADYMLGTPSSGTLERVWQDQYNGEYGSILDSNGAKSPAGNYSLGFDSFNYNYGVGMVIVSLAPAGAAPPSDSCTAPTTGDWYVTALDNCYISVSATVQGNLYIQNVTGPGTFNIIDGAIISVHNFYSTSTPINVENGGMITLDNHP